MSGRETEFQWKNFGFSGVSRERFYQWQWRVPPVFIIIYKILISAILISTLLYNIATYNFPIPWPAFSTYWVYTLLTTYHVVHTVVVLHHARSSTCHSCFSRPSFEEHHRPFQELKKNTHPTEETKLIVRNQQQNDDLPLHLIILWIVYSVLNTASPFVTCGFYIFIATPQTAFLPREMFVHALNTVIVLTDQLVSAIPVRLFHFFFPIVFGLLYYLFSILYWMTDHKHVVYKILLDWNHPAIPFGMIFATSLVNMSFHCISYGIYRARSAIYYRLVRGN